MAHPGSGGPWEWRTLGVADPGSGGPWQWRPLGVADPGSDGSWKWRTLVVADPNRTVTKWTFHVVIVKIYIAASCLGACRYFLCLPLIGVSNSSKDDEFSTEHKFIQNCDTVFLCSRTSTDRLLASDSISCSRVTILLLSSSCSSFLYLPQSYYTYNCP